MITGSVERIAALGPRFLFGDGFGWVIGLEEVSDEEEAGEFGDGD